MSKTTDKLRERKVYNTYGLAEKGDYYVTYTAYEGRAPTHWGWYLHRKGYRLKRALDGHRDFALVEAGRLIGEREWARDPFGAWWPADVLRERLAAVGLAHRGKVVTI